MGPDFEVIKILTELLDELDIGDYEVKLNHRKLLDGMLAICGVPQEKFRTICSSIDKLDKLTFEQIKKEMVEEKGLTEEMADKIGTLLGKGEPLESELALNELEILFKSLLKSKCIDKVVFDLSLARGLDYYTGVIFEAAFKGAAQDIRAAETEVLVCVLGDDLSLAAELVSELWEAKVKAEFNVHKRVMKHIDRARESKIPWMVIIGERELNDGIVKLKDVTASKEYEVPRSRLIEELQGRLNNRLPS
ncbi:Class II aaRS and biotin synthetases superfamily protein [Forsythia ovata]|uniref:histidine--tRNA ligase n=1 Tax=Forsythia ovata TaxID=205694 RepID=A0ABD1NU10_9LAMI